MQHIKIRKNYHKIISLNNTRGAYTVRMLNACRLININCDSLVNVKQLLMMMTTTSTGKITK